MKYRNFGSTELQVSETGFGAWAIGGNAMAGTTPIGWGPANDLLSREAIHAALDEGINFFDTADVYGLGHSETLLGKYLPAEAIIATKVGNLVRNETFTNDYSHAYIIEACEQSLRRLKRDTIDYYQLHSAKLHHLREGDCTGAMQMLQQQGKIRYWGISLNSFDPAPEAEFLMGQGVGNGFQLAFNLVNQRALQLIRAASSKSYGLIARMPLQFGLLTGKFSPATSFDPTDHRSRRLSAAVIAEGNRTLQPVWELCKKYSINETELALSFILSYNEISTVIPGMRSPEQVKANTKNHVQLDAADLHFLETNMALQELMRLLERQG